MDVLALSSAEELSIWEDFLKQHPEANLWQSPSWRKYQEGLGRKVLIYGAFVGKRLVGSALVVVDKTTGGYCTWDIPRGPIGDEDAVKLLIDRITDDAKREKCLALFLSPLKEVSMGNAVRSPRHEQPEATRILDLRLPENELLMQMKPKGRYNIGVAQKYAINVEQSTDVDAFYSLLQKTGGRDGFKIGSKSRYTSFLENIPHSFLLLAYHTEKQPIAGLLGTVFGTTGYYYYGASDYEHRQMMAPYVLQWDAMHHCAAKGCSNYDLLGVSPPDAPANHSWQGISSFKEKFGGHVVVYPPEKMILLKPFMWSALRLKRRILG